MNKKESNEFFGMAAWFLLDRAILLSGENILADAPKGVCFDERGCYTGMLDNAFEMKLLVREVKRSILRKVACRMFSQR